MTTLAEVERGLTPFFDAPEDFIGIFAALDPLDVHPHALWAKVFDEGVELAHIHMQQLNPLTGGLTLLVDIHPVSRGPVAGPVDPLDGVQAVDG